MNEELSVPFAALRHELKQRGYSQAASELTEHGISSGAITLFQGAVLREIQRQSLDAEKLISEVAAAVSSTLTIDLPVRVALLLECARYFQGIGKHAVAIGLASSLFDRLNAAGDQALKRRLHNALGAFYLDAANYQECLENLDSALLIATKLSDPVGLCATLANAMSALKELGHYHDAIAAAKAVIDVVKRSEVPVFYQFQCFGNGLFCAHRLQDPALAIYFLEHGNQLLDHADIDYVSKATYEYYRACYLIDTFDHETAEELIAAARSKLNPAKNPRVDVLLRIPRPSASGPTAPKPATRRHGRSCASSTKSRRSRGSITTTCCVR